jgi:hypothetical protein
MSAVVDIGPSGTPNKTDVSIPEGTSSSESDQCASTLGAIVILKTSDVSDGWQAMKAKEGRSAKHEWYINLKKSSWIITTKKLRRDEF